MLVLQIKPENRGETFSSSFSEAVTILRYVNLTKASQEKDCNSFPQGTQMWRLLTEQLTRAGACQGEHHFRALSLSSQASGLFCTPPPLATRTHQGRDSHGADPAEPTALA